MNFINVLFILAIAITYIIWQFSNDAFFVKVSAGLFFIFIFLGNLYSNKLNKKIKKKNENEKRKN